MKLIIFILLFIPQITFAAISISSPVAGLASSNNTTSYPMTGFTSTDQTLLVVFVFATGTTVTPTMTGGGYTWKLEASSVVSGSQIAIFWARVGASASTTITFDCTGDAATGVIMSVLQFTGYDALTIDPIKQTKLSTSSTTSTNANLTYTTALGTNNGYGILWVGGLVAPCSTAPTSWTETDDISYINPSTNGSVAYRAGGETTVGAYTFTNASTAWLVGGVEVYVAGAGPQKQLPLTLLKP